MSKDKQPDIEFNDWNTPNKIDRIPPGIELVIFDCYATLISGDKTTDFKYVLRKGVPQLLELLREKKLAVATDNYAGGAARALEDAGLGQYCDPFPRVYGNESLVYNKAIKRVLLRWGLHEKRIAAVKNLGLICKESDTHPCNAVMIGDNSSYTDQASSLVYSTKFIFVPARHEDPEFSFVSLMG
jgi:hypothetical protein